MAAPAAPPPAGPAQPMPPPAYGPPPPMYAAPPPQHTALPVAGGVMLLLAGILGLANWAWVIVAAAPLTGIPMAGDILAGIIAVCGGIGIIFSLIALLGGVFAIQRKMWGLALAGGILGLLSFSFLFIFLPNVLALIGLILVAVSHKEFQ